MSGKTTFCLAATTGKVLPEADATIQSTAAISAGIQDALNLGSVLRLTSLRGHHRHRMSGEEAKLKLKIEQAEAAVARAQKDYEEAEPGSSKDSCLQLLLAEKASLLAKEKALEQVREKDLLQQRAAAGAGSSENMVDMRQQLVRIEAATLNTFHHMFAPSISDLSQRSRYLQDDMVKASHIYKRDWPAQIAALLKLGVDTAANLFSAQKKIESAFDKFRLIIVPNNLSDYTLHILDPSLALPRSTPTRT
ncbi:hypothetical protein WJX82_008489 [Trebouxia sp. C0006]